MEKLCKEMNERNSGNRRTIYPGRKKMGFKIGSTTLATVLLKKF